MSQNVIQFQQGLSWVQFHSRYGSEAQCEAAMVAARWRCAHCDCKRFFHTRNGQGRLLWECFLCGYQSSSIAGTVMEHTKVEMARWAKGHLAPGCHVVSDGTHAFAQVGQAGASHERHVTGGGRQGARTPQLRWVNTLLGNLKTSLAGTLHSFDHTRYAARYLAEFAYRFNRRFDMSSMIPRLLRAAILTKPQTLRLLRFSEVAA